VVRPHILETTALGAAYLAGLAAGVWKNRGEISAHWAQSHCYTSAASREAMQARMAEWKRAVAGAITFAGAA